VAKRRLPFRRTAFIDSLFKSRFLARGPPDITANLSAIRRSTPRLRPKCIVDATLERTFVVTANATRAATHIGLRFRTVIRTRTCAETSSSPRNHEIVATVFSRIERSGTRFGRPPPQLSSANPRRCETPKPLSVCSYTKLGGSGAKPSAGSQEPRNDEFTNTPGKKGLAGPKSGHPSPSLILRKRWFDARLQKPCPFHELLGRSPPISP
jgi:hypothetical protein